MRLMVIINSALIIAASFLFAPSLRADDSPRLNDGKKWRIGYYEGGAYSDYTNTMRTLINGLIELGWIQDHNPPKYFDEIAKPYWGWLVNCNSPYLSFRPGDCYSANWDNQQRAHIRKTLLKKLKKNELDLVIAMGTWAGLDLVNNEHSIPTMLMSTSDPIKAGIIKSADNSGYDHVTARVDPNRYFRQIRMFHRIVGFNTLGIAYENTFDGRIYSAVDVVQKVAKERGFEVVSCEVVDTTADTQKSDRTCIDCYRQLARNSDAVYVTALSCVDRQAETIAKVFRVAGVPSFSMIGSGLVKKGLMLSISKDSGYTELGRYNAKKFGKILNGSKPISLQQVFEDPLDIAVNMETVRQIGFNMPKSILRVTNEIYEQ